LVRREFEEHVRRALDELPPHLVRAVRNVAVVVAEENAEDPDLYGLYDGIPLPERTDMAGHPPDTITIYRRPLVEDFDDPLELEEEIRITVLHELAHYVGIDEDRLDELGYG
jgi:predicted Zn-dependent protease with MMP-like domain